MKIYLHVNYWEGAGKLGTLFEIAAMNGYDGVELRYKYAFPDMAQEQYQEKVAALKQQHPDMGIIFGGPVDFMADDRGQVKKDTEAYLEFLEWANRECGTRVMNFFTGNMICPGADYMEFDRNGSGMAEESHYGQSAEGLRVVGDKAASLGMKLALETHNCYLHDLPGACRKLMDLTDHDAVGLNYDHGNISVNKNGSSIEEVFDLIGDKIYYVHLKNMLLGRDGLFLATHLDAGHIDTSEVLMRLKDRGYDGVLTTEYACTGDGFIAAKRDKEYVDLLTKWLGM
ncbi:MAG: TIM barrel protein [Verrucomicrobiota bacterium]